MMVTFEQIRRQVGSDTFWTMFIAFMLMTQAYSFCFEASSRAGNQLWTRKSLPFKFCRSQPFQVSKTQLLSKSKASDILDKIVGGIKSVAGLEYPGAVMGDENIMAPKQHGTSKTPVQKDLRWDCDWDTADRICNFNRHYAEYRGYWRTTSFLKSKELEEATENDGEITFYDSNTGKPLFIAPRGRDMESFLKESFKHGWPSFRDEEVVWENVRILPGGESVSVDGTHLGHNIPDINGNRHCINLVSVAGQPTSST